MGWKDVFAENLLLRWLAGRRASVDLAVSMAGVRLGERVLQVGLGDGRLVAALAGKVGYTGQVVGVDQDEAAVTRAERMAARAGVLVDLHRGEVHALPTTQGTFDLAIVLLDGPRSAPVDMSLRGVLPLLRPGGRCLVILPTRGGLRRARGGGLPDDPSAVTHQLTGAGFRVARVLAVREGLAFVEAMKAP